MSLKKENKTESITIRCTPKQKKLLAEKSAAFDMPMTVYANDKLFNGKERNKYAKRIMCKTLVIASNSIDEIYNLLEETDSEYILKEKILPPLNNAKKECDKIWRH